MEDFDPTPHPFFYHLQDLQTTLIRCFSAFALSSTLLWSQLKRLFPFLCLPYERLINKMDLSAPKNLISTHVFDVLSSNLRVTLFLSCLITLPYCLWEVNRFLKPALSQKEQKFLQRLILLALLFFYTGISLSYSLILPFILKQTLTWSSQFAQTFLSLSSYLKTLTSLSLAFGILFQIPILLGAAGYWQILSSSSLAKNRKWIILLSLLLSAVIAPPDLFSQILFTGPIFFLFEGSIWIIRFFEIHEISSQAFKEKENVNFHSKETDVELLEEKKPDLPHS